MTKHKCCNPQDNNKKFLKSIRKDALRNFISLVEKSQTLECNIHKDQDDLTVTNQHIRTWTQLLGKDIVDTPCVEESDYHNPKHVHNWKLVWEHTCPSKCSKFLYRESKNVRLWSKCCNDSIPLPNYTLRCENKSYVRGQTLPIENVRADFRYCKKRIAFATDTFDACVIDMEEEERYKW